MVDIQNEIKYRVALNMLRKLYIDGMLTQDEFDIAHSVVVSRYCPANIYLDHTLPHGVAAS